jgi:hypothetical protein
MFTGALAVHLVAVLAIAARERTVVDERMDVYQRVKESELEKAIVFLSSGTGVRRPMLVRDLTRNGTDLSRSVLYALDLGEQNQRLMRAFPDRACFRYVRDPQQARGHLEPFALRPELANAK